MTDERLTLAFRGLDAPLGADPAFAERLFEELAGELGFRPEKRAARLRRRVRRVLGLERPPVGARALRLAYIAAMIGLLLAVLGAAALIASRLERRPSPTDLVRLSQAVYDHPPAFTEVFSDAGMVDGSEVIPAQGPNRLMFDGTGTWRIDIAPSGSYDLYDGARVGRYDASSRHWSVTPLAELQSVPPFPLDTEFTWMFDDPAPGAQLHRLSCARPERLADTTVAGRPTDHLRCGDPSMEFWLDRTSHLILKIQAGPGEPHWDPAGMGIVATSLTLGSPGDKALFSWQGPPKAIDAANPPVSSGPLVVGQPLPGWSGHLLDQTRFDPSSMPLPAVLYLWWECGCKEAPPTYLDFVAAAGRHPAVHALMMAAADGNRDTRGTVAMHPTGLPVVDDTANTLGPAWGLDSLPAVVVVGADARVLGVYRAPVAPDDLEALFSAVSAGKALPSVAPPASPSP